MDPTSATRAAPAQVAPLATTATPQPAQVPQADVAEVPVDAAASAAPPSAAATQPAAAQPAQPAPRTIAGLPSRPAKTSAVAVQPAHAAPPSVAGSIGGTLFALALVLALIFGLAWLARRIPGLAGTRGTGLRVVASTALGARERLVVVEVGGQQLLLGTGASGTRLLHALETPLPVEAPAQPMPFAQLLAQQFGKKA